MSVEPLVITDRIVIPSADLELRFSRAGGPGGQHVNTTDSRVQLKFALRASSALSPSVKSRLREARPQWCTADGNLQLTCATYRSRHRNVDEARRRLCDAIRAVLVPPRKRRATRPSRGSVERRLRSKKSRKGIKMSRRRVDRDD